MQIERMNKGEWGKLRAFFDLKTSDGFVIKGFKIVEGINGLFVGMPSVQNKEGEYYDSVFADKDLRDEFGVLKLPLILRDAKYWIGIWKNNPLSKLPSPKSSAETFVFVKKAPTSKPLSKLLRASKVYPLSPARYLPA